MRKASALLQAKKMSELPSVSEMAANLAKDVGQWVRAGAPVSPQELTQQRLEVCRACEFFQNDRCAKCGCFMKAKANMVTAKCPLGKWLK